MSEPEHVEQPMPTNNERDSIQSMVRNDLLKREALGVSRYGTALQAFNGRDALRDAYEEALDLACYLRQVIEERDARTVVSAFPALPHRIVDRDGHVWICDGRRYHLSGFPERQSRTRAYIDEHYGPTREA